MSPWPWPDDFHIRTWPAFPGDTRDVQGIQPPTWTLSKLSSDTLTDRHTYTCTDRHDWNYIPRRFAGGQKTSAILLLVQFVPKQFPFLFHIWKLVRIILVIHHSSAWMRIHVLYVVWAYMWKEGTFVYSVTSRVSHSLSVASVASAALHVSFAAIQPNLMARSAHAHGLDVTLSYPLQTLLAYINVATNRSHVEQSQRPKGWGWFAGVALWRSAC